MDKPITSHDILKAVKDPAPPAPSLLEQAAARGLVSWRLVDEASGKVQAQGKTENLITEVGAEVYWERATGTSGAGAAPTGMKLGTDNTPATKSGSASALGAYLSDSDHAFDGGYPLSELVSGRRRVTYKVTWAAGEATSASPVREAVIVNESLSDATSLAAATIARVVLTGIAQKGADQFLELTWAHTLEH